MSSTRRRAWILTHLAFLLMVSGCSKQDVRNVAGEPARSEVEAFKSCAGARPEVLPYVLARTTCAGARPCLYPRRARSNRQQLSASPCTASDRAASRRTSARSCRHNHSPRRRESWSHGTSSREAYQQAASSLK